MQARTIEITWAHALVFRVVLAALMILAVIRAFGHRDASPRAVDPPPSTDTSFLHGFWSC